MGRIKSIFIAIILSMACAEHAMASCYDLSASACYADSSCEWSWSRDICTDACSTRTSDSTCDYDSADGLYYCAWNYSTNTCVYRPCNDFASTFSSLYLEQACDSSPACKWDSGTSACVTDSSLGAVPDSVNCSDIHNSTDCTNTNNNRCVWIASACVSSSISCSDIHNSTDCTNMPDNRCTWIVGKDTQGNSTSDTACIDTPQGVTGDDCSVIGNYYFSSNPSLARGLCQTLSNICVMIQGNGSCKKKMSSCPAGQYLDGMYQCADCPSDFPYSANNNSGTSESCYQKCLEGTIGYNTTSNNSHDPAECNVNNRDPCNLLNCQSAVYDGSTGQPTGEYTYRNIPTGCSSLGTAYCTTYNPANMLNYCLQFTTGTLAERQAFCNEYISDTESTSVKWGCYLNGNSCVSASQCSDITDSNLCANVTTLNCKWQSNRCVVDENCPTGQFIGPNDRCYTCDTMTNESSCTNQTHGACMWAQPRNSSFETTGTASCIAKPTKTSGQTTSQFCATIKKANFNNDNNLARGICYSLSECSWCGDCTAIAQTCSAGNYLETNGETNKCCWNCNLNTSGWPYSPGGTGGQNTCYKNCGTGSATYPNQCVQCCDGTTADSLANCPSCHSCTAVKVQDFCDGSSEVLPDCTWTNNKCEQWSNCNWYNSGFGQYAESWCSTNTKCIWRNSTVGCTEKCEGITSSSQCLPANGCTWVVGQDSNGTNTSTTKCVTTSEIPSTCTNITSSTYGTEDIARSVCNSQSSCVWNSESNGCKSAKTASNCSAGQYFDNRWCWSCPNEYPNSVAHSTGESSCYKTCSDSGVDVYYSNSCPTQCSQLDTAHCNNPTTWGCYITNSTCASADRCGGKTTESACTSTNAYSTTRCTWENNKCFSGSACYNITNKNVCNDVTLPGFGAGCRWDEEGSYCEQKHTDCSYMNQFGYYLDEANGVCASCSETWDGYAFIDPYDTTHPINTPNSCFDICYDGTKKYANDVTACPPHDACNGRSINDVKYTNGTTILNPCTYDDKCTIVGNECKVRQTSCPAGQYLENGWCYSCSDLGDGSYTISPANNTGGRDTCYRNCCYPFDGNGGKDTYASSNDNCATCSSCSDINSTNFGNRADDICVANILLANSIVCRWKDNQCVENSDSCYMYSARFTGGSESTCTQHDKCFWDSTYQECFYVNCPDQTSDKCLSEYDCTWVVGQNSNGANTSATKCITTSEIPACTSITSSTYGTEDIARGLCNSLSSCVWNSDSNGCKSAKTASDCSAGQYFDNRWCWSCPNAYPDSVAHSTGASSCYTQCLDGRKDYNNNSDDDECIIPTMCSELYQTYCLDYTNSVAWACYVKDGHCFAADTCRDITDQTICSTTTKFNPTCKWTTRNVVGSGNVTGCFERKTSCPAGYFLDDGDCKLCGEYWGTDFYIDSPANNTGGPETCFTSCCNGTTARPNGPLTICQNCNNCSDITNLTYCVNNYSANNGNGCRKANNQCVDLASCSEITDGKTPCELHTTWNCKWNNSSSTCYAPTQCSELTIKEDNEDNINNCTDNNLFKSWNCIRDGNTCVAPTQCSQLRQQNVNNCTNERFASWNCITQGSTQCRAPQNCSELNAANCTQTFMNTWGVASWNCVLDGGTCRAPTQCSELSADNCTTFNTAWNCVKNGNTCRAPTQCSELSASNPNNCTGNESFTSWSCIKNGNTCLNPCPAGKYYDEQTGACFSCSEATNGAYPDSDSGPNTSVNKCYNTKKYAETDSNRTQLTKNGNCGQSVSGKIYNGCTVNVVCNTGYYWNTTTGLCTECNKPTGWGDWTTNGIPDTPDSCDYICDSGYWWRVDNAKCEPCPTGWPISDKGSTSQNDCYTTCETKYITLNNQQVCHKDAVAVGNLPASPRYYNTTCSYPAPIIDVAGYGQSYVTSSLSSCAACANDNPSRPSGAEWIKTPACLTDETKCHWANTTCPWKLNCNSDKVISPNGYECSDCNNNYHSNSGADFYIRAIYDVDYLQWQYTYHKQSDDSSITAPQCVPNIYTVTLDANVSSISEKDINDQDGMVPRTTKTVYVEYDTGWFTDSVATQEINSNNEIVLPQTSHVFLGYYTDQNTQAVDSSNSCTGTKVFDENGQPLSTTVITSNTTLYACWGASITYTLRLNDGAEDPAESTTRFEKTGCTKDCKVDVSMALTQPDQLQGYVFERGDRVYVIGNGQGFNTSGAEKSFDNVFASATLNNNANDTNINFVLNDMGIWGLNSIEPERKIIVIGSVGACSEDYFCDKLVENLCKYGETTNKKGSSKSTDCKYFKLDAMFYDKDGTTFTMPRLNNGQLIPTSPYMTGKAYK